MPVLHEKCKHIITLLFEKQGSHTRINASGKAYTYLYFAVIWHKMKDFQ